MTSENRLKNVFAYARHAAVKAASNLNAFVQ